MGEGLAFRWHRQTSGSGIFSALLYLLLILIFAMVAVLFISLFFFFFVFVFFIRDGYECIDL